MWVSEFRGFHTRFVKVKFFPASTRRITLLVAPARFATYRCPLIENLSVRKFRVPGRRERGFSVGRISKLSFCPWKTMFCEVRRSFARISPVLCCSREREELLFGDFFRAPTIPCFRRPKKDPTRELWYFAARCFSTGVATTLPVLFRPPLLLFLHLTTRIRSTISSPCSARPTFDRRLPPSPLPFHYFSSFFLATSAGTLAPPSRSSWPPPRTPSTP